MNGTSSFTFTAPIAHARHLCALALLCSLLTSFTFTKLAQNHFSGLEGASKHKGILYGLGVDGETTKAFQDNGT